MRNTEARRAKKEGNSRHQMVDEEIKEETYDKDEIINELTSKVKRFEELAIENDKNSNILARLFDGGIIDATGKLVIQKSREDDDQ